MTKAGKRIIAAVTELVDALHTDDTRLITTTYTFDATGVPLTKTVISHGGRWTETTVLQPIAAAEFEDNLYRDIR